ncbi:hypothetical protein [Mycobacterium leprae]|uniref:hypothetical protein n=1 Tax=Mycobacterium leprae TaxID=1769 RepID=UPI0007DB7028|nr:hypothetical protein [Mycobacterium leprae]
MVGTSQRTVRTTNAGYDAAVQSGPGPLLVALMALGVLSLLTGNYTDVANGDPPVLNAARFNSHDGSRGTAAGRSP